MKQMQKVKGREGLVKDPHVPVVININESDYERYKMSKKYLRESKQKEANLEKRISKLESIIEQLIGTK